MNTLHVTVTNKTAAYSRRDGRIVCRNKDYQIQFTFDEEWAGMDEKTARFIWGGKYYDVEFTGDTCPVPEIYGTTVLKVGVYAGDLQTTTDAVIECTPSILCKSGVPHPESGANHTNEAKEAAATATNAANTATSAANTATAGANRATEAAANASRYATMAENAEAKAFDHMNTAGTLANHADGYAYNAQCSAEDAQKAASYAKASAEEASVAAEEAKEAAEGFEPFIVTSTGGVVSHTTEEIFNATREGKVVYLYGPGGGASFVCTRASEGETYFTSLTTSTNAVALDGTKPMLPALTIFDIKRSQPDKYNTRGSYYLMHKDNVNAFVNCMKCVGSFELETSIGEYSEQDGEVVPAYYLGDAVATGSLSSFFTATSGIGTATMLIDALNNADLVFVDIQSCAGLLYKKSWLGTSCSGIVDEQNLFEAGSYTFRIYTELAEEMFYNTTEYDHNRVLIHCYKFPTT